MLKPGTYRLVADFKSPTPDKRQKHDWRAQPVIPAGTLVYVRESAMAKGHAQAFAGKLSVNDVRDNDRGWEGLFTLLEPVPETPTLYLRRMGWSHAYAACTLLDALFAAGRFTMADVEDIVRKDLEGEDDTSENGSES
jgi:hypothetical protein